MRSLGPCGPQTPPVSQAAALGRPSSSPLGWVVGGGSEERKQWWVGVGGCLEARGDGWVWA